MIFLGGEYEVIFLVTIISRCSYEVGRQEALLVQMMLLRGSGALVLGCTGGALASLASGCSGGRLAMRVAM